MRIVLTGTLISKETECELGGRRKLIYNKYLSNKILQTYSKYYDSKNTILKSLQEPVSSKKVKILIPNLLFNCSYSLTSFPQKSKLFVIYINSLILISCNQDAQGFVDERVDLEKRVYNHGRLQFHNRLFRRLSIQDIDSSRENSHFTF